HLVNDLPAQGQLVGHTGIPLLQPMAGPRPGRVQVAELSRGLQQGDTAGNHFGDDRFLGLGPLNCSFQVSVEVQALVNLLWPFALGLGLRISIRSFGWGCNAGNAHQTRARNTGDTGGHNHTWGRLHWAPPRTSPVDAACITMQAASAPARRPSAG